MNKNDKNEGNDKNGYAVPNGSEGSLINIRDSAIALFLLIFVIFLIFVILLVAAPAYLLVTVR